MNDIVANNNYVSIFDDTDLFKKKLILADAISRTMFVPEAFRGRPEDCLIVIDLAGRMGISPTTLFPEVFVIDGRPGFSSKFLISRVNASGLFSRIEYETGVDGEADVTFTSWGANKGEKKREKKRVPNYYAIASFEEKRSGRRFTSPKVDLNFAERNQWVEKLGSKWQSMPEIMTRYRAAAILIKSVCPEILLGMEFAEDLADATAVETPPIIEGEILEKKEPDDSAILPALLTAVESAASLTELETAGKTVAQNKDKLTEHSREKIRGAYKSRRDALKKEEAEEKKEETTEESAEQENGVYGEYIIAIDTSADFEKLDELERLRGMIETAGEELSPKQKRYLLQHLDVRKRRIEENGD